MKRISMILALVLFSSVIAKATDLDLSTEYFIQNTDDYNSTNNKFYAKQCASGTSHGSWGCQTKPESGYYSRDDDSFEAQNLTGITSGDTFVNVTYTFSHTVNGTSVASCSSSIPINTTTLAQKCVPQIHLTGTSPSYSCYAHCNTGEAPTRRTSVRHHP